MKLPALVVVVGGLVLAAVAWLAPADASACCPAPPSGKPAVNADQTVVILWNSATKTEHFIRRASFRSEADDFGFLVPTPAQPELAESGDDVFPFLHELTKAEVKWIRRPRTMGRPMGEPMVGAAPVKVLDEKTVAGFQAIVLETSSAGALAGWLKERGYAFSPEVEAWAKPYVDAGWKITALRVAKSADDKSLPRVAAAALRMTFKTDRPLFPYREPESKKSADALGVESRLLRIYFLADARYDGQLTKDAPWTGKVAWAGKLGASDRARVLDFLKLPPNAAPPKTWLTEFEDPWPYRLAPADVTFARRASQDAVKRPPIIQYYSLRSLPEVGVLAVAGVVLGIRIRARIATRRRPPARRWEQATTGKPAGVNCDQNTTRQSSLVDHSV